MEWSLSAIFCHKRKGMELKAPSLILLSRLSGQIDGLISHVGWGVLLRRNGPAAQRVLAVWAAKLGGSVRWAVLPAMPGG
jgi:hypothetical protein